VPDAASGRVSNGPTRVGVGQFVILEDDDPRDHVDIALLEPPQELRRVSYHRAPACPNLQRKRNLCREGQHAVVPLEIQDDGVELGLLDQFVSARHKICTAHRRVRKVEALDEARLVDLAFRRQLGGARQILARQGFIRSQGGCSEDQQEKKDRACKQPPASLMWRRPGRCL